MGYIDAVKSCISKFVDFKGRATRSEYWYWSFTIYGIYLLLALWVKARLDARTEELAQELTQNGMSVQAESMMSDTVLLAVVIAIYVITLIPTLAVTWRRFHDISKSGWYIFLNFLPIIGPVLFLIFMLTESEQGYNKYGPNPHEGKIANERE